jgi:tetratricopeptide (TPR) repeat protein
VQKFLAEAYVQLDQKDKAVAMLETNLASGRRLLGADHADVIHQHWRLAAAYNEAGRGEDAEALQRQLMKMLDDRPAGDPMKLDALNGLANSLASQGKTEEADRVLTELYEQSQTHLPPDHSGRLIYASNYVNTLLRAGKKQEALEVSHANLVQSEKVKGASHPETSFSRYQTGLALVNLGDLEAASAAFRQAATHLRTSLGPEHYMTLLNGYSLAASLWQLGRDAEARAAGAEYFGSPIDQNRVKASGKADDPVFDFLATPAVAQDKLRR